MLAQRYEFYVLMARTISHSIYIPSVCLRGPGMILIHAERLQISDAPRKQNESISNRFEVVSML